MIQRIQSVFLLLVALSMLMILFVPIWVKGDLNTQEYVVLTAFELVNEDRSGLMVQELASKSTIYISILATLAAGVAFFSISQYKNRLTQMKLGLLNALLIAGVAVCIFIVATRGDSMMPEAYPEYKIGAFLPLIGLIFNSAANRFIRRDERLVRDSDRMR